MPLAHNDLTQIYAAKAHLDTLQRLIDAAVANVDNLLRNQDRLTLGNVEHVEKQLAAIGLAARPNRNRRNAR